jgi:nitrile hydratase accessory protein
MSGNEIAIDVRWLDGGPAFSEPWQAEAFALTMQLSRAGIFAWSEWVDTFSEEIRNSPQSPDENVNGAYYRQGMQALEKIAYRYGLLSHDEIQDYQEHWRRSYYHTEHGKPVKFDKGLDPIPPGALDDHDHDHDHSHAHAPSFGPVAVSRATF